MMHRLRLLIRVAGAVAVCLLTALPLVSAYAIADPDVPPIINGVYVYEDTLEDGDVGILIDYDLVYAALPTTAASEAYMAIFLDADGTTQLKASSPYVFVDSGYGHGGIWIRFTAAEVTTYSITSADMANYRIWLMGNPTLTWDDGTPPKTIGVINYWQPAGSSSETLLALRVLALADDLELDWAQDMIESTALGNRLTTTGESYFLNVIPGLRTIAPNAFADTTLPPIDEGLDYTTEFGAVMTNGTGTIVGSPITLVEGSQTITVAVAGTFTLELEHGTVGTMTDDSGTVTGSPIDLVEGTSTVTVTVAGTFTMDMDLTDTASKANDAVLGTAFDLSAPAAKFGMSRWMFSGIVWFGVTILICAASYKTDTQNEQYSGSGAGKNVMLVFDICIIGGGLLGLLHPIIAAILFICFGAFTGYILFFRGANV